MTYYIIQFEHAHGVEYWHEVMGWCKMDDAMQFKTKEEAEAAVKSIPFDYGKAEVLEVQRAV